MNQLKKGIAMLPLIFLCLAIIATIIHLFIRREASVVETLLSYLIFFNIGILGLLSFYFHTVEASETALSIGWLPDNPFQYEVAVANLAFGVLGVLSLWLRGFFWVATIIGSTVFLVGAFVVHLIQYSKGNISEYNIGYAIWIWDVFFPLLYVGILSYFLSMNRNNQEKS